MNPSISDKNQATDKQHSRIWLPDHPMILASNSRIRSQMLTEVMIPHEIQPAAIDERALEKQTSDNLKDSSQVAATLAEAKAITVSNLNLGQYVLGADQTCMLGTQSIHKPKTIMELRSQIQMLRGKAHCLMAAAAIAKDGKLVATCVSTAIIAFHDASDSLIESYINMAGKNLLQSVGGYQIEHMGPLLISKIEGDMFTIMGMPLLSILELFRQHGLIAR